MESLSFNCQTIASSRINLRLYYYNTGQGNVFANMIEFHNYRMIDFKYPKVSSIISFLSKNKFESSQVISGVNVQE